MVDAEVNKRWFLLEKIQDGEKISSGKTPWTEEQLEKASDKVVDKLYKKYQNFHSVTPLACPSGAPSRAAGDKSKVNTQEALEVGKPVCPVVIELYTDCLLYTSPSPRDS